MLNLMYTWEMIDSNHTKNIGTCLISFTLTRNRFISPPTDSALFSLMRSCLLTGLHHIKGNVLCAADHLQYNNTTDSW